MTNNTDTWVAITIADIATVIEGINRMLTEATMTKGMLTREPIRFVPTNTDKENPRSIADSTSGLLNEIWNTFYLIKDVLTDQHLIEPKEW